MAVTTYTAVETRANTVAFNKSLQLKASAAQTVGDGTLVVNVAYYIVAA